MTATERLLARCVRAENGCLRFTGAHNRRGYGCIYDAGKVRLAHRVAYENASGPIPLGLTIDHVYARGCRYRDCVEPTHLEAVTNLENQRRRCAANKSHCPQGHEMTPENVYTAPPHGRRKCRACRAAQSRRQNQRRALRRELRRAA